MRAAYVLATALALLIAPAAAQSAANTAVTDYRAPRTSFGQPSLEGAWVSNAILPLEAIPEAPNLVVPEAEAKKISNLIVNYHVTLAVNFLDPEVPDGFR